MKCNTITNKLLDNLYEYKYFEQQIQDYLKRSFDRLASSVKKNKIKIKILGLFLWRLLRQFMGTPPMLAIEFIIKIF